MKISVLVASFGAEHWRNLALSVACPSAQGQGAHEVLCWHGRDSTLAAVRNDLAARATGDVLCFVDADDRLGDGYLDAMRYAHMERGDAETWTRRLLVPSVQYVRDGRCVGEAAIPNRGGWPEVNECVIGTLVPRALFLEVGGFRDTLADGTPLTSIEDYDAFLRMYDAGARLVYVPAAVYCATVNAGSRNADQSPYEAIWAEHESRCRESACP